MKKEKTKEDNSLKVVLMKFRHSMTTSLLEEAKEKGLTLPHFEILLYIAKREKVTMKEIASWLHITPPSASVLVKNLMDRKLVTKVKPDRKIDHRSVYIGLGEKAEELFHSVHKKKMPIFKKMLFNLNEEDKKDLARILIKCVPN